VYDYGHDGWSLPLSPTPAYMGDYTYPGSPFEGWEVQMNGVRSQQYASPAYSFTPYSYSGAATMTAAGLTAYSNSGGAIRGFWAGDFNGGGATLHIDQETRIDTFASAVVVTTTFHNTSGTAATGVYYWRSCDPDNDETYAFGAVTIPGAGFPTDNVINWQNAVLPNPKHKVSVTGTGQSTLHPPLTLCTKDCRAVAVIYNAWGLTVSQDLSALWNQTYGGAYYNVGANHPGDIGIGLVYNIGTIPSGDSAIISYAYVFNGPTGIDDPGALPDPMLYVAGDTIITFPDTLNGCLYPGVDSLPVDILFGDDKDWSWGHWTWTPSTGLSSTTGVHNHVILSAIPGDITYTVTGVDSGVYMNDCLNAQFIFTVHSCHQATGNNPCEGGTIYLGMLGDSTGATYYWYGPAGFTSSLHDPVIYPAAMADTGLYYVVRTIGGVPDTDNVHVMVHPLPIVTPLSSIGVCDPLAGTLTLNVNLDSAGEAWQWSGPLGFSSTLQSPVITPFDSSMEGTYIVTGTTVWGCSATGMVNVWPGVSPHFTYDIHRGCGEDTVIFSDQTTNAGLYVWAFGHAPDTAYSRDATEIYPATTSTVWDVKLIASNAHCTAIFDTLVDTRHSVHAIYWPTPDTFCLGTPSQMLNYSYTTLGPDTGFVNCNCYTASSYWDYGNGVTDTVNNPAPYTYDACGMFISNLTVTDSIGCTSTATEPVYVIQLSVNSFHDTTLCISMPLPMTNVVSVCPTGFSVAKQFVWTQNMPNLSDTSIQNPTLSGLGLFVDTLTISYPGVPGPGGTFGCAIRDTVTVDAVLGAVLTDVTPSTTISYGSSINLNANNEMIYYWVPNDGTLSNNNINDPIASPSVTTTYTVYGLDVNGCLDSAYVTIYVDTSSTGEMPSAFTPNHDGTNDEFRVVGAKFARMVEMRVYNRWGEEIFFTNDRHHGWDGTFHGVPQDMGVYNYVIIIANPDGENATYKGNVTLIR